MPCARHCRLSCGYCSSVPPYCSFLGKKRLCLLPAVCPCLCLPLRALTFLLFSIYGCSLSSVLNLGCSEGVVVGYTWTQECIFLSRPCTFLCVYIKCQCISRQCGIFISHTKYQLCACMVRCAYWMVGVRRLLLWVCSVPGTILSAFEAPSACQAWFPALSTCPVSGIPECFIHIDSESSQQSHTWVVISSFRWGNWGTEVKPLLKLCQEVSTTHQLHWCWYQGGVRPLGPGQIFLWTWPAL